MKNNIKYHNSIKYEGKKVDGIRFDQENVLGYPDGTCTEGNKELSPIKAIGSRRKGMNISKQQFEDNWDRIFNKKDT